MPFAGLRIARVLQRVRASRGANRGISPTLRTIWRGAAGSGLRFPEHHEQHPGRCRGIHGMRHAGRHADDGAGQGLHRLAPDRERERAVEHDDQRIERRGVLAQPLSLIECKERDRLD